MVPICLRQLLILLPIIFKATEQLLAAIVFSRVVRWEPSFTAMAPCRKSEEELGEHRLISARFNLWGSKVAESPPSVQHGDLEENGMGALLLNIVSSSILCNSIALLSFAAKVWLLLCGGHRRDT
jgi:hypothetical protein